MSRLQQSGLPSNLDFYMLKLQLLPTNRTRAKTYYLEIGYWTHSIMLHRALNG